MGLNTMVTGRMARKKEKECNIGKMEMNTKDHFKIIKLMDLELGFIQMVANTPVNS